MPFRTRDFVLFSLLVAFLLVGIGSTIGKSFNTNNNASVISFGDSVNETDSYKAVLPEAVDERSSRLTTLKTKVAAFLKTNADDLAIVDDEPESEAVSEEDKVNSETIKGSISLCTNYAAKTISWNHNNLKFEIVEGARLVYRDQATVAAGSDALSREVVIQLPLRTFPLGFESCLKNDIVGIAMDGSLIRNDDYTIYRIFGSETLVGYALDGFPIYGLKDDSGMDSCGGVMMSDEYRYYLSSERNGVIGCFSDTPINI